MEWGRFGPTLPDPPALGVGSAQLRGPYVVDYTDIPHEGDTKTLWTPQVGDVLLRLFHDWNTFVNWDHGLVVVEQTDASLFAMGTDFNDVRNISFSGSAGWRIFNATDPVCARTLETGGTDPTQGHVELYAVVGRAIAP